LKVRKIYPKLTSVNKKLVSGEFIFSDFCSTINVNESKNSGVIIQPESFRNLSFLSPIGEQKKPNNPFQIPEDYL